MRRKYSYPETYSNRNKLIELLSLSMYAYEVSRMDIKKPNKLRDAHQLYIFANGSKSTLLRMTPKRRCGLT